MKRNITYAINLIVILLVVVGCYKDKGNYVYDDLNTISITAMDSTMMIMAGEQLELNPTVSSVDLSNMDDPKRFSYRWLTEKSSGETVTLGTERNLSVAVQADNFRFNAINYIYFVVTDEVTAARSQFRIALTVETETTFTQQGWYILAKVGQGSQLSLIATGQYGSPLYPNVLQAVGSSLKLENYGAPYSLAVDHYANLFVSTKHNAVYLPVEEGLAWKADYTVRDQFIQELPASDEISYAGPLDVQTSETNIVFANGNYYVESPQYEDFYGVKINQYADGATPFKASPYFGGLWQERGALLFDEDKKQFALYKLSFSASYAQPVKSLQVEGGGMTALPVGKDLRFMAKARYTGERGQVYAILRDVNQNFSLLRFEGRVGSRTTIVLKGDEAPIVATDFDKAEHIAVNPLYGYIYYNVGSKIYAYDPIGTKQSKLMWDMGNKDITLLKFDVSNIRSYRTDADELNKLVVGTYDKTKEVDRGGSLTFFHIPSAMGSISPVGDVYDGLGEIKDVSYINSK